MSQNTPRDTSGPITGNDTLRFPIEDRRGDRISSPARNPFDLKDPSNIKDSIGYDPKTRQYFLLEKVGSFNYRKPSYLTFEEFMRIQSRNQEIDYFKKRSNILSGLNKKLLKPKLSITDNLFNRIFGNGKVEIRPQGNVDIIAGYQGQNIKNPTLPERARKNGGFDFDMNANLSVIANIGDKLKLPINYNTLATFDFENQLKLDYSGSDDEIIKRIEAGNVSFTSKGSLIPGAQSLFGLKTQLQFGKLFVTGVLANQRAQRQSMGLQGGSASAIFDFRANDYEENRHFLLGQYFRQSYNKAMGSLPAVNSLVQILRMEVWVTNRNGSTTDTRDIVALMDLGEISPFLAPPRVNPLTNLPYPFNEANDLYSKIISDPSSRNSSLITSKLSSLGLTPVQDFEKTFARKLYPQDYFYNPQIGFLSLNQPLQPDEVLGVAYQYTYNGKVYQVGEFSQDIPPDTTASRSGNQKVLFLKLLKATSQRPNLPIWDLMMKNVYALKTRDNSYLSSVQPADFKLNVLYEEPSLGPKRYLPEGPQSKVPLLNLLNLDRLNNQRDPQPDGVFDYIEGFTIISSQARIIFPYLEPFGRDLETIAFNGASQDVKNKYVYYPLYDTIKEIAKTFANLDRFIISGSAKGQSTSEISLGAFNVPQGSVTVSAGGRPLVEGVDYTVDYNLGSVRIINQAIVNAGLPVNVQFENNAGFGIQQRNFLGLRLDYLAKNTARQSLTVGASLVRLGERPFFTKMNYNEDPIRNTIYGLDFSYRSEFPQLTRWLDKLPFYNTSEMSTITGYGEAALLKPGHPPQIGKGRNGLIYIDDFEGTRNSIDLRFPLISWSLASTPQNNGLFPEGSTSNALPYGYNRAKIAWYNIEPNLQDPRGLNNPVKGYQDFTDPRIHALNQQQLYPAKTPEFGQGQLVTFDLAYYPTDKGPYNFDASATGVSPNGKLLNPKQRWGGIMRGVDQVDFETGNVEFIEFWMQDPFLRKPNSSGGQLYFNLGNVSEDVLRDGKRFFENGLPTPNIRAEVDSSSVWGKVPANPIQVTQAFSNDPGDRPFQDVGFDGLDNIAEQRTYQAYLQELRTNFGVNSRAYQDALNDPANDDFKNYRDEGFDAVRSDILARYKHINSPEGNSPIAGTNATVTTAFTLYPDQEDLNRDNTLNELEEYFQYKVDLVPGRFQVGQNYITDTREFTPNISGSQKERWYLFRIPIAEYESKVGNIPDFKSIRFMRMFMTNFEDSVVCRFAKLELVRNQWRRFTFSVDTSGQYKPLPQNALTDFNVLAVNVEENSSRRPIPYVIPPDIERVQQLSNNNVNILQNEQSLSMRICNLASQDARGVFKTLNLDLRQYGRMQMFIHAESVQGASTLQNKELNAIIRIGNDFINNFYEIKIPLQITRDVSPFTDSLVWPRANELDLDLQRLTRLKVRRNNTTPPSTYFKEVDADGKTYAILGNPNLGEVRGFFMGIQNTSAEPICTEAWFNELRLSSIDEKGGWAALARVDMKLADLGTLSLSGNLKSRGFGTLEQRVNERSREDLSQFDVATNLELGKLLPSKAGISIPVYAGISQTLSSPEYDPYDLDIKLKDKIKGAPSNKQDSIRSDAVDVMTTKTLNFTNVKKMNVSGKRQRIWSIENVDVSYSYTKTERHNPLIENEEVVRHRAGLGYNYTATPRFIEPFKRKIKSKSPWYDLVRDFNFNPAPSLLSFRADINRQFGAFRPRNVGGPKGELPETFDKYFTFDRYYNMRWDLTRSLNVDFTATNRARVDEGPGRLDQYERSQIRNNLFKGGRNTNYDQTANFSYVLPTGKLPLLNWTTVRVAYVARYSWLAASLDTLARSLGNFLSNAQEKNATGELDFTKLYRNSRFLRAVDWDAAPAAPPAVTPPTAADTATAKRKKRKRDPNELPDLPGSVKFVGRLLTSVKRMTINYSETGTTNLAGYVDSTQVLGMNTRTMAPGWDFVLGHQPDTNYINRFAEKGRFTKNPLFNTLNRQDYNQKLSITAQLIPLRDLTIDVNVDKTFGKTYSELYKDTIGSSTSKFVRLNPYTAGSFNVSFVSFQTMFEKFQPNEVSATFKKFEANRLVLSQRLGKQNQYIPQVPGSIDAEGYYKGYGKYAQDVVIPAFIAAYTNQDPTSVTLLKQRNPNIRSNPFSGIIPKPNWRITYNGLTRIPGMEKIFTNFTVSHAYTSNLSMNSFNSALLFRDELRYGQPQFVDPLSGNYIPYFLVPNVSISEAFAPLIDLDVQFTNQVTARFEYKKSRQLSLSLIDFQLSETRSTEFVIGAGWRKRGFQLPFKLPFTKKDTKKLENDINFRLDFSLRDDATSNSRLDQDAALPTAGQKVIGIAPSIDYVLNNRVNIKLYFDQRRVEPKISTSAPIITTRAGVQIRISLAQ